MRGEHWQSRRRRCPLLATLSDGVIINLVEQGTLPEKSASGTGFLAHFSAVAAAALGFALAVVLWQWPLLQLPLLMAEFLVLECQPSSQVSPTFAFV